MEINKKTVFRIEPVYKSFVWAGRKLIDRFGLKTDLDTVGTIYSVLALPGEIDNPVTGAGMTLSELYRAHRELFGTSDEVFPVRMTITCNEGFQSYQSHPDDAYAMEHEGCRGKVSGAVALDESDEKDTWLFGHKPMDAAEFRRCIEEKEWDALFSTLEVKGGDFVHTPAGVIHGGWGSGKVSATFGTNSDITYRFYDNDRNDPNRPLSIDDVCACASFPELPFAAERAEGVKIGGVTRYVYHDVPGEYTALRFKAAGEASFDFDSFLFVTCVEGGGTVCGEPISPGETLFIPLGYGPVAFSGQMDCIAISYHEKKRAENE
ncbi:class I mannose-6-phosphate isomerase [Olsenella sp. HMSC062G07]|uniref:class I mannose-6-phosphate isomerase n=1 Tax=Olsenella sp. HMSC062G07 TaxID=1739330 RepID=UPI0008A3C979|nr:hypothetical protein [Olsenella sp. HMSC062G07]OFK22413.1 hypothetical protein HMPREF2826_01305 [Olsenella sp. HMSC062G07]